MSANHGFATQTKAQRLLLRPGLKAFCKMPLHFGLHFASHFAAAKCNRRDDRAAMYPPAGNFFLSSQERKNFHEKRKNKKVFMKKAACGQRSSGVQLPVPALCMML